MKRFCRLKCVIRIIVTIVTITPYVIKYLFLRKYHVTSGRYLVYLKFSLRVDGIAAELCKLLVKSHSTFDLFAGNLVDVEMLQSLSASVVSRRRASWAKPLAQRPQRHHPDYDTDKQLEYYLHDVDLFHQTFAKLQTVL